MPSSPSPVDQFNQPRMHRVKKIGNSPRKMQEMHTNEPEGVEEQSKYFRFDRFVFCFVVSGFPVEDVWIETDSSLAHLCAFNFLPVHELLPE